MNDLELFRNEQLKDPEFHDYFLEMQPAADISKAIIAFRVEHSLTQKDFAEIVGIDRADIGRLEACEGNPTLKTMKRLAAAMNTHLKIEFVPAEWSLPKGDDPA